ncbi:MAG: hypothetical protein ACLS3Y_01840 [Collinsella sp.]
MCRFRCKAVPIDHSFKSVPNERNHSFKNVPIDYSFKSVPNDNQRPLI